jgi:hypothetical protein
MRPGGWIDAMSTYAVNKLCRDALHDLAFREALKRDPAAAMAPLALNDDERRALLAGDVAYLVRWELFGLTAPVFSERMRALAGKEAG